MNSLGHQIVVAGVLLSLTLLVSSVVGVFLIYGCRIPAGWIWALALTMLREVAVIVYRGRQYEEVENGR